MTVELSYFLIVTDTNSRQYMYKIEEDGVTIDTVSSHMVLKSDESIASLMLECFDVNTAFVINGTDIFNPPNISAVQIKSFPTAEAG
jgi:hypothetical protein